jgi:hypothetical protein
MPKISLLRPSLSLFLVVSGVLFAIVSFLLQLYSNIWYPDFESSDAHSYRNAAAFLYFKNGLLHPTRPPIFPAFLSIPLFFGASKTTQVVFVAILNGFFHFLTLGILYKMLARVLNPRWAFGLGLLYALNLGTIAINCQALTEPLYTLILLLGAYFFQTYLFSGKKMPFLHAAWCAFYLSLGVRPTLLPLFFVLSPFVFYFFWKETKGIFQPILALVLPWSVYFLWVSQMNTLYGTPRISNIGELAYFTYFVPYVYAIDSQTTWKGRIETFDRLRRPRMNAYEGRDTLPSTPYQALVAEARSELKTVILTKPKKVIITYFHHLVSNSVAYSLSIYYAENIEKKTIFPTVKAVFKLVSRIQNIFWSGLLLLVFPLFFLFSVKNLGYSSAIFVGVVLSVALWVVCISGLSFTQADRFNIVTVPLVLLIFSIFLKKTHLKNLDAV